MSLEIIIPGSGSTLFSGESLEFPGVLAALALGPEGTRARVGGGAAEVVVARALDTLPGAAMRAALLERAPLAILEGLWLAAFAAGAAEAVIAVETESGLAEGIAALERFGGPTLRVAVVPRAFMASEDTALMRILEGRPALASAPRVALGGKAAAVFSIEDLIAIAHRFGGREAGRLVQVQGAVKRPGLVEIPPGTTLRAVVFELCGGMRGAKAFKFALAEGCFIPGDGLDIPATGLITIGDEGDCVVDAARRALALTAYENCGICTICREGSHQLEELLADASSGETKGTDEALIQELDAALREGSLCAIGRRAPDPLLSGLRHFAEDFDAHFKRKRCPALVCKAYVTFHILGETCTGCGKCLAVCPEGAIEGEEDYIHVIDQGSCTRCGLCFDVCPPEAAAVAKAGALKPRTPKEPIPVGTWKKR
ncbi:MAG: 4Fe-4S dicluster domain-containing protein [Holophaga sp.]|nr:4Fe-4S dicluster domain-containing protein [Holophaga sp.]